MQRKYNLSEQKIFHNVYKYFVNIFFFVFNFSKNEYISIIKKLVIHSMSVVYIIRHNSDIKNNLSIPINMIIEIH